ncbi:MAG: hypothetical protein GX800_07090 [Clostridiaceae bacterium]|nr:hypothetical protein [Clostridiaceae bacterium]
MTAKTFMPLTLPLTKTGVRTGNAPFADEASVKRRLSAETKAVSLKVFGASAELCCPKHDCPKPFEDRT